MNMFRLIAHASLLIHMGHDVKGMIDNLVQHKEKFPSSAEFMALLDDALEFLGAGLIPVPDDVLKQMIDAVTGIKAELSKQAAA